MKSKTGALLTKIAAVINFVVAVILFIFSLMMLFMPTISVTNLTPTEIVNVNITPQMFSIILLIISVITFVIGLLFLMAAKKMQSKENKVVKNGAIWAIVLGIITLGQLSGILALVGGIIAIVDADKK